MVASTTSSERCLPGWDDPSESTSRSLRPFKAWGKAPSNRIVPHAASPHASGAGLGKLKALTASRHRSTNGATDSRRKPRVRHQRFHHCLSTWNVKASSDLANDLDRTEPCMSSRWWYCMPFNASRTSPVPRSMACTWLSPDNKEAAGMLRFRQIKSTVAFSPNSRRSTVIRGCMSSTSPRALNRAIKNRGDDESTTSQR